MLNNIVLFITLLSLLPMLLTIYQQAHYNIKEYICYFSRHFIYSLSLLFIYTISILNTYLLIIISIFFFICLVIRYFKLNVGLKLTKRMIRFILLAFPFIIINSFFPSYVITIYLFSFIMFISSFIENYINRVYHKKAISKRNNYKGDVIGITGSFGKTTTKYYIAQILSSINPFYTKASYNTLNGISFQINQSDLSYYKTMILEMGSNHLDDIKKLTKAFLPNIAIITGIGPMHLDSFKTIDNVIKEKMSILSSLDDKGIAILNFDNSYIKEYDYNAKGFLISYGKNGDFNYKIYDDYVFIYAYGNLIYKFKNNNYDEIDVSNSMPGIILATLYNIDINIVISSLENLQKPPSRQKICLVKNSIIIDDSFNSNIVGATKALNTMKNYNKKRIIITPGFVECRGVISKLYREYANKINEICDYAYIVKIPTSKMLYDLVQIDHSYISSTKLALKKLSYDNEVILIENDVLDIYY